MEIFLNEKCLLDRDNPDEEIIRRFIIDNLENLYLNGISIFTRKKEYKAWIDEWQFDEDFSTLLLDSIFRLTETGDSEELYYYYFINHQNFTLGIDDNISKSSLAYAADKNLLGHKVAILTIPNSRYSKRPYLPILKSPFDLFQKDDLATILTFNSSIDILNYLFLENEVRPLIKSIDNFEEFKKEYHNLRIKLDFSNSTPNTKLESNSIKINPKFAFPASDTKYIKQEISKWTINQNTIEENIELYNKLGGIVLRIHGYTKNLKLSGKYKYNIYEAGKGNKKLLISIDQENGAFEVIDYTGTHIGVYGYLGNYIKHYTNKLEINKHSLIGIDKNMFLF